MGGGEEHAVSGGGGPCRGQTGLVWDKGKQEAQGHMPILIIMPAMAVVMAAVLVVPVTMVVIVAVVIVVVAVIRHGP